MNEFLYPFVMETIELLHSGLKTKAGNKSIEILNFVLDAPARTGIKKVKHINGYLGCDICLAEGEFIENRMTFPNLDAPLRNDNDYRERNYDEYHHDESMLEQLPMDMIRSFPLDDLHCLYLGVMKRILGHFKNTKKSLSVADWKQIEMRIVDYASTQPVEYQRRLRSFAEMGNFKGTEFRQYLLVVAPVLLKGIIGEDKIKNLIMLQIASIIFTHGRFKAFYQQADILMRQFLNDFSICYGPRHLTYVFHGLCHLKVFTDLYGPLTKFSTFAYESENYSIKQMLRGPKLPVVQVANRILEKYQAPKTVESHVNKTIIQENITHSTFNRLQYCGLKFIADKKGQNWMLLKGSRFAKFIQVHNANNETKVEVKVVEHISSLYDTINTLRFNIVKIKKSFFPSMMIELAEIDGKLWELNLDQANYFALFPIYIEDAKN